MTNTHNLYIADVNQSGALVWHEVYAHSDSDNLKTRIKNLAKKYPTLVMRANFNHFHRRSKAYYLNNQVIDEQAAFEAIISAFNDAPTIEVQKLTQNGTRNPHWFQNGRIEFRNLYRSEAWVEWYWKGWGAQDRRAEWQRVLRNGEVCGYYHNGKPVDEKEVQAHIDYLCRVAESKRAYIVPNDAHVSMWKIPQDVTKRQDMSGVASFLEYVGKDMSQIYLAARNASNEQREALLKAIDLVTQARDLLK